MKKEPKTFVLLSRPRRRTREEQKFFGSFFQKRTYFLFIPIAPQVPVPEPDPFAWLKPRLSALVEAAEQAGIARDVSVAVITDLINGPLFSPAPPEGVAGDENWNRDIGEPAALADARIDRTIDVVDATLPTGRLLPHGHGAGDRIDRKDGAWRGGPTR